MKLKFVGRATPFKGKRLFDIIWRLSNFGVGRLVYRHCFSQFAEPSYFKITRVEPFADRARSIPLTSLRNDADSKHIVYGVEVHRGKNYGETVLAHSFYPDWRLVPKDEENKFLLNKTQMVESASVTESERFPPLLEYMIQKSSKVTQSSANSQPMLRLIKPKAYEPIKELK